METLLREAELAGGNPRHVQEVVNETRQVRKLPREHATVFPDDVFLPIDAVPEGHQCRQGVERVSEFVTEGGEKLVTLMHGRLIALEGSLLRSDDVADLILSPPRPEPGTDVVPPVVEG